ncbi:chalcone isomerase family protein [Ramlibacter sp.]|uniref:chalcone isomerase family protein n=1 Tax=Ramlibacter sp. TaxID=1917967 RepID=UPI0017D8EB98|nr:chalcone isomerase family protein [Ramlibacter sp.]MBA2676732.1 chalcone isomerase family protein [Ramlibacter sp.]
MHTQTNPKQATQQCVVDGQRLSLAGAGLRKVFAVTLYEAKLFAAGPVRVPGDLYRAATPLRLSFEYLYGPIGRERMALAWDKALRKSVPANAGAAMDAFTATITDYRRGDTVHYDLLPDGTTQVVHNGELLARIVSQELRTGILDVMVGGDPIDPALKAALVPAFG